MTKGGSTVTLHERMHVFAATIFDVGCSRSAFFSQEYDSSVKIATIIGVNFGAILHWIRRRDTSEWAMKERCEVAIGAGYIDK